MAPMPVAAVPAPVLQPAAPAKELFKRTWSFEDGPSQDLIPDLGSWTWKKQSDGKGAMDASNPFATLVVLPVKMPGKPLKIEIVVYAPLEVTAIHGTIEAYWCEKNRLVPYKFYTCNGGMDLLWEGLSTVQIYANSNHITLLNHDKQPNRVFECEKPYPSESLCLAFHGVSVRGISISELAPEEIPAVIRDLDIELKSNKRLVFEEDAHLPASMQYMPGKLFRCHAPTHCFVGKRPQTPADDVRK
jgi:hypothetical protein